MMLEHDSGDSNSDADMFIHSAYSATAKRHPLEALRFYLEGGYYAPAKYDLDEINKRRLSLIGAVVTIVQNEKTVNNLFIKNIIRVSPSNLYYFENENIIRTSGYLDNGEEELFITTCGWKVRGEEGSEGKYVWSRYIIVVGKQQ